MKLRPSYSSITMKLSDVADLEPVNEVSLQRLIPLSEYNKHRGKAAEGDNSCLKNVSHLKIGLLFAPHGSSEGLLPSVASLATEVIDDAEQGGAHANISLEQLDEFMLPKAIDCLRQKAEATAYQMSWKSRHGTAFLQVEKTGLTKMPPRRWEHKVGNTATPGPQAGEMDTGRVGNGYPKYDGFLLY